MSEHKNKSSETKSEDANVKATRWNECEDIYVIVVIFGKYQDNL